MALGDYAAQVACTGTLSISVTYVCPECSAGNVTPIAAAALVFGISPQLYLSHACASCGRTCLLYITTSTLSIRVQQTS